jgi:hypothetical protein
MSQGEPIAQANHVELRYSRIPTSYGGLLDVRGTLLLAVGVVVSALLGTTALTIAMRLHPLAGLAVGLGEGIIVGEVLSYALDKVRVHQRGYALVAAVLAALLAIAGVYFYFWLQDALAVATQMSTSPLQRTLQVMQIGFGRVYQVLDAFYAKQTGHTGLVGCIAFRLGKSPRLPLMLGVHALATLIGCLMMILAMLAQVHCATCGKWLGKKGGGAVIPQWQSGELAHAIKTGDVARLRAILDEFGDAPLGSACAIATYRQCPVCDALNAWVSVKTYGSNGASRETPVTDAVTISEEMRQAFIAKKAAPTPSAENATGAPPPDATPT